jgi:hypothetical protein
MQALRGKVVLGKVVVEGGPLEEGMSVTVLVPEKEHPARGPRVRRDDERGYEPAGLLRDLGGEG